MQYQTFSDIVQPAYPIAILAPKLEADNMKQEYLDPICLTPENVIAYELLRTGKKTPATTQRDYLDGLIENLVDLNTTYLLVADSEYFKTLTGVKKSDSYLGYVLPNVYPEKHRGRFQVIFVPNYRQVFYDPLRTRARILQGLEALYNHAKGQYQKPGDSIIHYAAYPQTVTDIAAWLQKLHDMECALTCDIEGFSLKHYDAGIGTISFAWNKHEGIAFPVDLGTDPKAVRQLLIQFFKTFEQRMIYHNISYDGTVLIYQLFMDHLIDTEGLLDGLDVILRNWDDTKLITYFATNSCAGNELGLKIQAQEFAGNYAQEDIKDITKIPLPELLEYNLVDSLSTWYVWEKHWGTMVADDQLDIYQELFKPAIWDIIQMQLTGMPVDPDAVQDAKHVFETDRNAALAKIQANQIVREFTELLNQEAENERYDDWLSRKEQGVKVRAYTPGNFNEEFNPNSPPQKQRLLYEIIGLPIVERTKTKQPGTGGKVINKLKAYTEDPAIKELLTDFLEFGVVDKLMTTFIPVLESAVLAPDGCYYIFGNFNLGGTLSGRLSSSDPNLQTIPSKRNPLAKKDYSKLIKACFVAPNGWVMIGVDFNSLEDMISALTTKDPNKIKVYTDGFDGHCLRAQSYFAERMPEIEVAPEGKRCFKATIGDKKIYFHEDEEVEYLGTKMTGLELWDRLSNVRQLA